MSLYESFKKDIVSAMKSGEKELLATLRTLDSHAKNVAIACGAKIPEDEHLITAATKAVKQGKDAAEQFINGAREDLAKIELSQVNIFKAYLPQEISVEELTKRIHASIDEVGAKVEADFGKVMKVLVPKIKGVADGKVAQQILKTILQEKSEMR